MSSLQPLSKLLRSRTTSLDDTMSSSMSHVALMSQKLDNGDTRGLTYGPQKPKYQIGANLGIVAPLPRMTAQHARRGSASSFDSNRTYDDARAAKNLNDLNAFGDKIKNTAHNTFKVLTSAATDRLGSRIGDAYYAQYWTECGYAAPTLFFDMQGMCGTQEGSVALFCELEKFKVIKRRAGPGPNLYRVDSDQPIQKRLLKDIVASRAEAFAIGNSGFCHWGTIVLNAWRYAGMFELSELIEIYRLDCACDEVYCTPENMTMNEKLDIERYLQKGFAERRKRVSAAMAEVQLVLEKQDALEKQIAAYKFR